MYLWQVLLLCLGALVYKVDFFNQFQLQVPIPSEQPIDTLPQGLDQARQADYAIFGDVPIDHEFYATADTFHESKPGELLKLKRLDVSAGTGWDIPAGTSIYLMQYTSAGLNGSTIPVTGFIALPFTTSLRSNSGSSGNENQRLRLIAFAHGTTGTMPNCAPSRSYNLFNALGSNWGILSTAGYAVVATDYAGLGNNHTTHPYGNLVSNSDDVYFSVVAARSAFPHLFETDWAAVGHSQGGGAIWALNENPRLQGAHDPSGRYLGGVAGAPAVRVADLAEGETRSASWPYVGVLVQWMFEAVEAPVRPWHLTPEAQSRIRLIRKMGLCIMAVMGLNADLPGAGVETSPAAVEQTRRALVWFQEEYGAGMGRKAAAPLLVVQGSADVLVNPLQSEAGMKSACQAGNAVQLSMYPGLSHEAILAASAPEWLRWLDDRFQGVGDHTQCGERTRAPLTGYGVM